MKILESYKKIAKSLLIKEDVMGKKIKYKDKDGNEKEATVGGILKKGENHPAYGVAKKMADKGGEEKPKGKVAGKGDFERDFDDDPTRGDPDDAWDDEEGRAKPSGGDIEDHEIEALISPLEVDDFIEKYDDKLSDEQKDELYDLGSDLEAAEGEMATGQIDDDEYEDKISDIQGQIANVVRGDGFEDDDSQGIDMTVKDKKAELIITFFLLTLTILISASLVYFVEVSVQPDKFTSIPYAIWWSVAAVTSVGYGDVYPITPVGQILGSFTALCGVVLFALPAAILTSGFNEVLKKEREEDTRSICPHCNREI